MEELRSCMVQPKKKKKGLIIVPHSLRGFGEESGKERMEILMG